MPCSEVRTCPRNVRVLNETLTRVEPQRSEPLRFAAIGKELAVRRQRLRLSLQWLH